MTNNKSGFTLIELLIVIGIIAILAAAIIIAINPGQQFAQARDATRQGHINSLNNAILSYMVSNYGDLSGLGIPPTATEICANTSTCEGLVNLEPLLTGGHLSAIPIDPSGGIDDNGTGYFLSVKDKSPVIGGYKSETRSISIGSSCPEAFRDSRDGNDYAVVEIGDQCWMADNLKYLPTVVGPATPEDPPDEETLPYYYVYGYDGTDVEIAKQQENYDIYGVLYNHVAARISCPDGWRLPSDNDFMILEDNLGCVDSSSTRSDRCLGVGSKLSLYTLNGNNSSGFNARFGGKRYGNHSTWAYQFYYARHEEDTNGVETLWTSTYEPTDCPIGRRRMNSAGSGIIRMDFCFPGSNKVAYHSYSVRCLKN